jgi:hypothetical protein
MTGLQLSNLNRAITKGAENNVFALPKGELDVRCLNVVLIALLGPSGKVKLAPKAVRSEAKEVSYFV